jgi:hypothetical protein
VHISVSLLRIKPSESAIPQLNADVTFSVTFTVNIALIRVRSLLSMILCRFPRFFPFSLARFTAGLKLIPLLLVLYHVFNAAPVFS